MNTTEEQCNYIVARRLGKETDTTIPVWISELLIGFYQTGNHFIPNLVTKISLDLVFLWGAWSHEEYFSSLCLHMICWTWYLS